LICETLLNCNESPVVKRENNSNKKAMHVLPGNLTPFA